MLVTLCKLQKRMVIDMTKNDVINDVVSSLVMVFKKEDLEIIKSTFIVKKRFWVMGCEKERIRVK